MGIVGHLAPRRRELGGGGQTVSNSLKGAVMGMESLSVVRARLELMGAGGRFSFRERG